LRRKNIIIEAENGKEGYIKALEHTPDIVITTLGLPDISGEELVKRKFF
jgi:YesN/AraC family two-component response regulator